MILRAAVQSNQSNLRFPILKIIILDIFYYDNFARPQVRELKPCPEQTF